jgi:integrase
MGRTVKESNALQVKNLRGDGLHFVGGVPGLALSIKGAARYWLLRVMVHGKRRDMGIGPYPEISLADAREAARQAREAIRTGADPIAQRQAERSAKAAELARLLTFDEAAAKYIEAHSAGWRNAKHAAQWEATLRTYASPTIGALQVADVSTAHVRAILDPIWREKTETATRVRGRIEAVLDWAVVAGHRPEGLNPARWRGHLALMLPPPRKVTKIEHHRALPAAAMYALWKRLQAAPGLGARALQFGILTSARSGEVRGATWGEIDLAAKVWTVPADRMKSAREHRVPLSDAACELLRAIKRGNLTKRGKSSVRANSPEREEGQARDQAAKALVFPSAGNLDKPLSDMTLAAVLKRLEVDAVPHGFRSTFRDWSAESTSHPRDVCEMALAHAVGNKVEAAYRRGDLFDKRRALMDDWARFLATPPAKGNVRQLRGKVA